MATALRDHLRLPLIAKDALKETLGEQLEIIGRTESQRLGVAVFFALAEIVHELLAAGVSVIAEGNFTNASPLFRDLPAASITQVHVTAAPDALAARMRERAGARHSVHYDGEVADQVAASAAAGAWGPLELQGELVSVDTTTWPDLDSVCAQVAALV